MMQQILSKLTSGRFILTMIVGGVFAYATIAGLIEAQAVTAITIMVIRDYFERRDRANGQIAGAQSQGPAQGGAD
jgi:hypothetical protein